MVLIVEDENGEIVRETMKDSDAIMMCAAAAAAPAWAARPACTAAPGRVSGTRGAAARRPRSAHPP